jgi:hypothetical protein
MFGLPDAKRVKRSRLFHDDDGSQASGDVSRSASPTNSESAEKPLDAVSYGFDYDFVAPKYPPVQPVRQSSEGHPDEDVEPEYQFRLFTSKPTSEPNPDQADTNAAEPRIKLSATPEPAALTEALSLENAHFVRPHRPEAYYFTSKLPEETLHELKSQYQTAAVSTLDLISRAHVLWPGASLPWRIVNVKLLNKPSHANTSVPISRPTTSSGKRLRPSKKRRILVRRRLALREERAAQAKVVQETEQEKRTRRNREKKVKKKERDKRKKLEAAGGVGGDGSLVAADVQGSRSAAIDQVPVPLSDAASAHVVGISQPSVTAKQNERHGGPLLSSATMPSILDSPAVDTKVASKPRASTARAPTSASKLAPTARRGPTALKTG